MGFSLEIKAHSIYEKLINDIYYIDKQRSPYGCIDAEDTFDKPNVDSRPQCS